MKHELQATHIAQSSGDFHHLMTLTRILALSALVLLLVSCDASTDVEGAGGGNQVTTKIYTGNPPEDADVLAFQKEFFTPLSEAGKCADCHTSGEAASGYAFVEQSDVNDAYREALKYVDITNPANSRIISKVTDGHNCWDPSITLCTTRLEGFIDAWLNGATSSSAGRDIVLTAPLQLLDPSDSIAFPATSTSFGSTIHPLLTTNCASAGCHSSVQSPLFAVSDTDAAYEAAKPKINLNFPETSNLVTRLEGGHNCWTTCSADATTMLGAINDFLGTITTTPIDPSVASVSSKAMTLGSSILASGGSRVEANQIALWEFKTGFNKTAFDTSGNAIDLKFTGDVSWVLGYGINFKNGGFAKADTTSSKKLYDEITPTGSYSIEAWVIPGNVTQQEARIASYTSSKTVRNFAMSQTLYNYEFLNRTNKASMADLPSGNPSLLTNDADEDLQATLQHVVMTFDQFNGRRIYVNGVFTDDGDDDAIKGGNLSEWSPDYVFYLGGDAGGTNPWTGTLRMVAIHNSALTQAQITQNFQVGVGQKYFMLFSIAHILNIPETYILFEVEQFDNTAYLFNQPKFISLTEPFSLQSNIEIKGMRIAVNGRESVSGQSYGNISANVNAGTYTASGQLLSTLGTVIPVELNPQSDQFFLTFEKLGSAENVRTLSPLFTSTFGTDPVDLASDIGVKTFDEINTTMSTVTGVPVRTPQIPYDSNDPFAGDPIGKTFSEYKQQLPTIENISAFLASHQMAIAQLAMSYCNEAITRDTALPLNDNNRLFKGFDFSRAPATAFATDTDKNQIIEPLLVGLMNVDAATMAQNLSTQPDATEIKDSLGASGVDSQTLETYPYTSLITTMLSCPAGGCLNDATRTKEIALATCAATLGSALTLIQ